MCVISLESQTIKNVRLIDRHTSSAYSMGVQYTLVLLCNVHVYFVLQLHTCSLTRWHMTVKRGLRIECLYGEFLAKVLTLRALGPDMHWKSVQSREVSGSWRSG